MIHITPGLCADAGCQAVFGGQGQCVNVSNFDTAVEWTKFFTEFDLSIDSPPETCFLGCGCQCFKKQDQDVTRPHKRIIPIISILDREVIPFVWDKNSSQVNFYTQGYMIGHQ